MMVYTRQSDGVVMERQWNYEWEDYGDGGDGSPFWDTPHWCRRKVIKLDNELAREAWAERYGVG